jgi:hypothetical protein
LPKNEKEITMSAADFCIAVWSPFSHLSPDFFFHDTIQISQGKFNIFLCTPAGSTSAPLDDCGLCNPLLARPDAAALYPIPVRQVADLLHASFRPNLTV